MKRVKSYISIILSTMAIVLSIATLCSFNVGAWGFSNKQYYDFNNHFNKAIINIGNETIEVEVKYWTDYEDGEQLQIIDSNGTVYLTSSFNCTLINDEY